MDDILLKYILELLKNWHDSFFNWANTIGDKIASIKTNTDNLPGIKADTADIKDNTAAVITPINSINFNVASVASDVSSIKTDTTAIKNNAGSIATSSGATAAFAEDIANNTLDSKNRLVTIGSDTTQIRTDSDSIAADVTEIKNTLGLYLYNTIVTEDAEGSIANFDTDLKDYLQEAKVTIPADAGGISGLSIVNQLTEQNNAEIFKNVLIGNWGYIDLSSISWNYDSTRKYFESATYLYNIRKPLTTTEVTNWILLLKYTATTPTQIYNNAPSNDKKCAVFSSGKFYISDQDYTDATAFTNSLNGMYLLYEYATPITPTITKAQFEALSAAFGISLNDYTVTFTSSITDGAEVDLLSGIVKINTSPVTYDSITPLAIRTFKGVNNIYSDIGDIDVTYRETLKHYLEKQNANSRSLNRNVNLLRENIESIEDSDRREI